MARKKFDAHHYTKTSEKSAKYAEVRWNELSDFDAATVLTAEAREVAERVGVDPELVRNDFTYETVRGQRELHIRFFCALVLQAVIKEEEIDHMVNLPVDARNQSLTQSTGNLAKINIRENGSYVVMGQQFTEEQVSEWTKQQVDKKPDIKVLIRCDQDAKHLYLANVLSICRNVGVPKANIAAREPPVGMESNGGDRRPPVRWSRSARCRARETRLSGLSGRCLRT